MTPVVRPARITDGEQVAQLIKLALGAEGPEPEQILRSAIEQGDVVQVLAGQQGVLAVGLGRVAADEFEIHGIAVAEASRRQGHGSSIVTALEAAAAAAGATHSWLEVRASNAAAQALYRRLGYVETGRRPRYYRDGEDAVLMNHALGSDPC